MNTRPKVRIRCNLTLDPEFVAAVKKVDDNLSRFVERVCWEYLKRIGKRKKAAGP